MALEFMKTFDVEEVADKFDTTPQVVKRVLKREDIQTYLEKQMMPLERLAQMGTQRLLEESIKTAFDEDAEWKERTENRKLLARSLLPEFKKVSVEHRHMIQVPERITDMDEWAEKFKPQDIVEAEVIDDEE